MPRPVLYPQLVRADQNRVLGGVCAGIAAHLGVELTWVRLAFLATCFIPPLGLVLYPALWMFIPLRDQPQRALNPVSMHRIETRMIGARGGWDAVSRKPKAWDWFMVIAGLGMLLVSSAFSQRSPWMLGLCVVAVGIFLIWKNFGPSSATIEDATASSAPLRPNALQWGGLALGVFLLLAGCGTTALLFLTADRLRFSVLSATLMAAVAIVVGFIVTLIPLWLRLWSVASERAREKAKDAERARIAGRIHDSVLQTLTLIQKQSAEPEIVAVARSQERQLRQWLFGDDESVRPQTLFGAVRVACGEVEDTYGVQIRPVIVGEDQPTDERLLSLVFAGREAMVNAAKHSGCSEINVYLEAEPEEPVEMFVRDRGPGFSLSDVPEDRQGVRHSIMDRMERAGGSVNIDSGPEGTEVILMLKQRPSA